MDCSSSVSIVPRFMPSKGANTLIISCRLFNLPSQTSILRNWIHDKYQSGLAKNATDVKTAFIMMPLISGAGWDWSPLMILDQGLTD